MTGPSRSVRQLVRERDRGLCLRCGAMGSNVHHRVGRGMGGTNRRDVNEPAALVTLCGSGTTGCHGWITEHPAEAYELGWAIRRSETTHPSEIPLTDLYGRRFFLTEEGALVYLNGAPL